MQNRGLEIEHVEHESIAAELGLEKGDRVLEINGSVVRDIIDYKYLVADEDLQVVVEKTSGEQWLLDIEKDFGEPLGIFFKNGGIGRTIRCANKCVFCFVDQMPAGMRQSLYVKDDDYRLSFAQGNFITLTNVGPAELERIAAMRLSPLYISVHTTNPELREKIMGHPKAGRIMEQLSFLADAGIEMHTQAVLCPQVNDGVELNRTIEEIGFLWPAVKSLAVVPVGLTAHRKGLFSLRPFTAEESRQVIAQVQSWQEYFLNRYDYPLVFASDEFYLSAGLAVPPTAAYGGFPQTENGVGLVRLFMDEWERERRNLPLRIRKPVHFSIATGVLAGPLLQKVTCELNQIEGVQASLYVLKNNFFGHNVTVAGLLTGEDILKGLAGRKTGRRLYIPSVTLRDGRDIFLDDITIKELSNRLGVPVIALDGPKDLVRELVSTDV